MSFLAAAARWWFSREIPRTRLLAWSLWALFVTDFLFVSQALLATPGEGEGAVTGGLPFLALATVGAIVASRWPRAIIGWSILAFPMALAVSFSASLYLPHLGARPGISLAYVVTLASWLAAVRLLAARSSALGHAAAASAGRVPFSAVFALVVAASVLWLLCGLIAGLAVHVTGVRAALVDLATGAATPSLIAETTRRVLEAGAGGASVIGENAAQSDSLPEIAWAYAISALNLGLAIFVMRLRGSEWAARALALGLVGTAALLNLQAHAALVVAPILGTVHSAFHTGTGVSYVFALLLFPDGRLLVKWPRRRWLAWPARALYAVLPIVALFLFQGFHGNPAGFVVLFGVLIPVVGLTAQALRYRHARTDRERQQSRTLMTILGLAFAAALVVGVAALVIGLAAELTPETRRQLEDLTFFAFPTIFAAIPVALVLVMVRYHLWDIDKVINRALVYSLATAVLALTYGASVVILSALLGPVTQGSELAVAGATLVTAAVFRTARERIQTAIDRRFFRHRYSSARALDVLARRLRSEVDVDAVRADILRVVYDTVRPVHASVWLRETRP